MDNELNDVTLLRDKFAIAAMQAFIAEYFKFNGACFGQGHLTKNICVHAYEMADAMLQERAK